MYEIETNIPVPTSTRGSPKKDFRLAMEKLNVNDSFLIPDEKRSRCTSVAKAVDIKIITRKEGDKVRVLESRMTEWQDISTAPKDMPILAWCNHDANEYHLGDGVLTIYGAHVEGLSHCEDGLQILEWGGALDDHDWEMPQCSGSIPDWWFVRGTDFEMAANPTHWQPLPAPPESTS